MRNSVRRRRLVRSMAIAAAAALFAGSASGAAAVPSPDAGDGYWMLGVDGLVYAFGEAPFCGHDDSFFDYAVDILPFPDNSGYWTLTDNYVDYSYCGSDWDFFDKGYESNNVIGNLADDEFVVSMSATPDGSGYWVFTTKGRVIPFGAAQWYGDMSSKTLNGPVLDSVATPSGNGYYMVASDGGIFTFGDARFSGSMGGQRLNQPVMSMAPDPDGLGYWLVASDGGIFAFDAPFYGSMGAVRLNEPVSGIVASPTGAGYLMVATDGGVFTFGDVPFHGSLGANPPLYPVVSIAAMS